MKKLLSVLFCLGLLPSLAACVAQSKSDEAPGAVQIGTIPKENSIPKDSVERPTGAWRVTLLPSGKELEFLGEVTPAAMSKLAAELKAHPEVEVLQLTSPGGQLIPAESVAKEIAKRHLTTFVPLQCMSACTMLFLAGQTREVAEGAALGFHRSSISGAGAGSVYELAGNEAMRKELIAAGVAADFAAKVLDTSHTEMWFPSIAEMERAHVITGTSAVGTYAQPSTGQDLARLLDWAFFNDPSFGAFASAYPKDFELLRQEAYEDIVKRGHNDGRLSLIADNYMDKALNRALGETSLTALRQYWDAMGDLASYVTQASSGSCRDFSQVVQRLSGKEAAVADSLGNRLALATIAVFAAAPAPGAAPPSQSTFERAIKNFLQALVQQQILTAQERSAFQSGSSEKTQCQALAKLLSSLGHTPGDEGEVLMRGFGLFGL